MDITEQVTAAFDMCDCFVNHDERFLGALGFLDGLRFSIRWPEFALQLATEEHEEWCGCPNWPRRDCPLISEPLPLEGSDHDPHDAVYKMMVDKLMEAGGLVEVPLG